MDSEALNEGSLRRLSYADLQRCAKLCGLKANAKAEKLITAIASENANSPRSSALMETDDDKSASDVRMCQNSGRSSRRRTRTFSIEKSFCDQVPDVSCVTLSPQKAANSNLTPARVSGKNIKSILNSKKREKSVRLDNGHKCSVSFVTPDKKDMTCSAGPPVSSPSIIRNRERTPAAVKYVGSNRKKNFPSSPISETFQIENRSLKKSPVKNVEKEISDMAFCGEAMKTVNAPIFPSSAKSEASTKAELTRAHTPNFKNIHKKVFDKMESLEEYQQRRLDRIHKLDKSGRRRSERLRKNIESKSACKNHSRALCFDELKENAESMTLNVQPRRKASSKIPVPLQGSRFVPSVTSVKDINTNFNKCEIPKIEQSSTSGGGQIKKRCLRSSKTTVGHDNVFRFEGKANTLPLVNVTNAPKASKSLHKKAFDLKASLAKKLTYKPYRGPLKPLTDVNMNDKICQKGATAQFSENKAVVKKREITRDVLKGVRKNKRFELQMSYRPITANKNQDLSLL